MRSSRLRIVAITVVAATALWSMPSWAAADGNASEGITETESRQRSETSKDTASDNDALSEESPSSKESSNESSPNNNSSKSDVTSQGGVSTNSSTDSPTSSSSSDTQSSNQDQADSSKDETTPLILPSVSMHAHVHNIGWQKNEVSTGKDLKAYAGTVGQNLPVEAYTLSLGKDAPEGLGIEYSAYVKGQGWQAFTSKEAGTTGKGLPIEAIKVQLTGDLSSQYDVYYSAHLSDYGWLGWAKDGEAAGVVGYFKTLQAFKVVLVKKGDIPSVDGKAVSTKNAYIEHSADVASEAHVANIGWMSPVDGNGTAGTTGKGLSLQALKLSLINPDAKGTVEVQAHVRNIGWQNWTSGMAGTVGRNLPIEAIRIRLTGDMASKYDIYYQVHSENYGWLGWAKNGERAGTQSLSRQSEAIRVKLVLKTSQNKPQSDKAAFIAPTLSASGHSENIGWRSADSFSGQPRATVGTTGRSLTLQAFSLVTPGLTDGDGGIAYSAHVHNIGWMGETSDGGQAGTTGRNLPIEAVKIRLTGTLAQKYDVWYRAHLSGFGWLDWTDNGAEAGSTGLSCPVEAVEIALLPKGSKAPGATSTSKLTAPGATYSAHVANIGWMGNVGAGGVAGTVGRGLALQAFKASYTGGVQGSLSYRAHVANIGWMNWVGDGQVAGTVGQGRDLQALSISLNGAASKYFDVWYRVQIQDFGWLGWTKNGGTAGTTNCGLRAEAFQIVYTVKGGPAPGSTANASFDSAASLPYIGYQNPWPLYQVSNRSVFIKNLGVNNVAYRTPSRIPYNASRLTLVNTMVTRAMEYLGTPYIWDYAAAPGIGVDCAGLVMQALYADGMDLSPFNPWDHFYTPGHDQYANGMWDSSRFRHVSFDSRQPGDLICYPGHIAIYLGGNRIIEAWPRAGVQIRNGFGPLAIKGVLRPIV